MEPFKYGFSRKIIYWGCLFDSLLELKYAVSIHENHEFLRAHVPIYYDPSTKMPVSYIRTCTRRYTPDFLIRNKNTGDAFWVEIKPRAFSQSPQLLLRRQVAENYIRCKNYDWQFKVVFDDEIILTDQQQALFNECRKLVRKSARKLAFEKFNR